MMFGEHRDTPLSSPGMTVPPPEEAREIEPTYIFDPGIDEGDPAINTSPEEYITAFFPDSSSPHQLNQFAKELRCREPYDLWPQDWEARNDWIPSFPLDLSGADIPLRSESAKENFEDWMRSTDNPQMLLRIEPTQDQLPSSTVSQPPVSPRLPLPAPPSLAPILKRTSHYWSDLPPERVLELETIMEEAFHLASRDYGIPEAIDAGQNFQLPTTNLTRDLRNLVQHGGDLRAMTASVQASRSDERLSLGRISASLDRIGVCGVTPRQMLQSPTCIDTLRLARLAVEGITIPRYEGFSPNLRPPNPKAVYKSVHTAVNCIFTQLWEHFLVFIVPTVALMAVGGVHFTPTSWTTKVGRALGRYIFDARSKSAGTPLNCYSPEYLADLRREWGYLTLPTIKHLVRMVLQYEHAQRDLLGKAFDPALIILLKGDLSKAFTLLSFSPESVELTASELYQPSWEPFSEEQQRLYDTLLAQLPPESAPPPDAPRSWSTLYSTGSFGLRILPFVFGVVTRVLLFLLHVAIWGSIDAYVDDFMGVTSRCHLSHDVAAICEVVTLLLGPHAIEWGKWYTGRQVEWIGWRVDLDTRRVSFGRRNFLKVLHGFFSFNETKYVQGRFVLKLASWASRYTTVLRSLSPFTSLLYSQISGLKNIDAYIRLDEPTIIAIWLWRATLLQLAAEPVLFSRPLDSFSSDAPQCLLEYDSCLTGSGLIVSSLESGDPTPTQSFLLPGQPHCGQFALPWACGGDSSFQNTAELCPAAIGLAVLAQLGVRHARVCLKGDSMTSLAWAQSEHFSGSLCTRTAVVMMLIAVEYDFTIVEAIHIPGDENGVCDDLSRFNTTPQLLGFTAQQTIDFSSATKLAALVKLCDPTLPSPFRTEQLFLEFWAEVKQLIVSLRDGL